jgi:hypothetical protein
MQGLVVIDGPDAPTEYRFDMTVPDGAVLLPSTDGGAVVVDAEGLVVAPVAPAWAVDANGQPVPTHYRIDGTTIVQVIDHHGAAYPVVGVPCWWGWSCLKQIVKGAATGGADGAVGGCVMGALPTAWGGGFGCLPGAAGGAIVGGVNGGFGSWLSG